MKNRFLKSIVAAAKDNETALPFSRQYRLGLTAPQHSATAEHKKSA